MAVRGGDFNDMANKYAADMHDYLSDSEIVGDLDSYKVKHKGSWYSIWDSTDLLAIAKVNHIGSYWKVDDLWVSLAQQNKKLLSKLLWFFR